MPADSLDTMGVPDLGHWITTGFTVIAIFLVVFGAWAGLVPIDSAAIAHGTIESGAKHQLIQHLEGGIVREILVTEHAPVHKGEVLVRFDTTRAQAALDLVSNQHIAAQAQVTRLLAEQQGRDRIDWPDLFFGEDPGAREVIREETDIFQQRISAHRGKLDLIRNKSVKSQEAVSGARRQLTALNRQFTLIQEQVTEHRANVSRGLISRQVLNELEREMHSLDERRQSLITQITAGEYEVEESLLRIKSQETEYANEVAELLHAARLNLSDLSQKLKAAMDVLSRTEVLAPYDGIVINLHANTLGGVLGSGQTIMEIVPSNAAYMVSARIRPGDIDVVRKGSTARIRLTAFKQRITPSLDGAVDRLSADILFDEVTGETYYEALIAIDAESLRRFPKLRIYPGMDADVMILSESRTVLEYLFQPVFQSFSYAFRET